MSTPRLRLGQLLVDAKLISAAALDEVLAAQKSDGRRLGTLLVERGLINETQLTQILSHQLAVPWVSLLHIEFSRQLLNLVPRDVADRYCLVPIYVRHVRNQGDTLYVAMDDPSNDEGLRACREHSGLPVRAMIAPPTDIRSAIRVYYGIESPRAPDTTSRVATPPPPPPESRQAIEDAPTLDAPVQPVVAEKQPVEEPHAEPSPVVAETPAPVVEVEPVADAAAIVEEALAAEENAPPAEVAPSAEEAAPPEAATPDAPEIEAVEVDLSKAERLRGLIEPPRTPPPPSAPPVDNIPRPRGRAPRMVALTLLDGTTITLPAKRRPRREQADPTEQPAGEAPPPSSTTSTRASGPPSEAPPGSEETQGLTARDLVLALRVVAHGGDASEVLGTNVRWESLFSALLSLMLKKHLIADWEFVEELKKQL
jgi:hypothetical protein